MDETERRLLLGTYLQLSLMNRANVATAADARTIDTWLADWIKPEERNLLARPAQPTGTEGRAPRPGA